MTLNERVEGWVQKAHGGNVSAAARQLDVPVQTLWQVCFGLTKSPSTAVLVKLANGMGVTIDFLIKGDQHG